MAWSYRRRIKIIPGVHLNFNKKGISTSIGVKGASMTFGKSGTFLNTSIPILGIRNRQKLSGAGNNPAPQNYHPPTTEPEDNIFSADIQEITSQDMQGVKEAIIMAHQQRKDLKNDLLKIQAAVGSSKLKLTASYILLYGLIKKSIAENIKTDIRAQQEAIKQLKEQIENCYVSLDIDFEPEIQENTTSLSLLSNS